MYSLKKKSHYIWKKAREKVHAVSCLSYFHNKQMIVLDILEGNVIDIIVVEIVILANKMPRIVMPLSALNIWRLKKLLKFQTVI